MTEPRNLTEAVEVRTPADRLLEATLPEARAHREGDERLVHRLLEEDPTAAQANIWVASATGEVEAVRGFIEEDASSANARGGTRHWEPLLYLCFSRLLRTDPSRASAMVEIAKLLLERGADPNVYWIDSGEATGAKETPVYGAAGVANNVELARLLIDAGADPNDGETPYHMVEHDGVPCADFVFPKLVDPHRGTALGHKLDYDDLPGLRKMLELGGDPDGPTPFHYYPIHSAVWRGRSKPFFDLLLEHGADVNLPNKEGRSAYAMAARAGKTEIMGWLVEAGASTELSEPDAFIAACAAGDADGARSLLASQPDLFDEFGDRERGEICEAAAAGNLDGVRTMLDLGWDIDTRNGVWAETAVHRAALHGNLDLVKLLAERGADLTLTDRSYHSTPLGWAQHGEAHEVIEYFRSLPDRLDIWDAIELGQTERALALLPGVDVNAGMRGASAGVLLRLASGHGNLTLVTALLENGADPVVRTPYGANAIDVARERGHHEIASLLERHGKAR